MLLCGSVSARRANSVSGVRRSREPGGLTVAQGGANDLVDATDDRPPDDQRRRCGRIVEQLGEAIGELTLAPGRPLSRGQPLDDEAAGEVGLAGERLQVGGHAPLEPIASLSHRGGDALEDQLGGELQRAGEAVLLVGELGVEGRLRGRGPSDDVRHRRGRIAALEHAGGERPEQAPTRRGGQQLAQGRVRGAGAGRGDTVRQRTVCVRWCSLRRRRSASGSASRRCL